MVSAAQSGPRSSFGTAYSTRANALNLIRLVLAIAVVLSHSITLGGFGSEDIFHATTVGTLAVYGFFGISGYLIAASATKHTIGRFLAHRVLRIFPAFWVCLVVTALAFGWFGWVRTGHPCGAGCYFSQPVGPVGYMVHNAWLRMNQLTIAGTLHGAPFPLAWNGSLWTLFYEFLCYLLVGALSVVGLMRRPGMIALLAVCVWGIEVWITAVPSYNAQFNGFQHVDITKMLTFVPVFLTGVLLYLWREKVPDSGWLALACLVAMVSTYLIPVGSGVPGYTLTRGDLSAPLVVLPLLWLGAHFRWSSMASRNDYSYGVYIYAFPVAQALALLGVYRWGYAAYTGATLLAVAPFAATSWWLIERRALSLKDIRSRSAPVRTSGAYGSPTG